jgi:hypothetical protein
LKAIKAIVKAAVTRGMRKNGGAVVNASTSIEERKAREIKR